jgi:hypothetical protein
MLKPSERMRVPKYWVMGEVPVWRYIYFDLYVAFAVHVEHVEGVFELRFY